MRLFSHMYNRELFPTDHRVGCHVSAQRGLREVSKYLQCFHFYGHQGFREHFCTTGLLRFRGPCRKKVNLNFYKSKSRNNNLQPHTELSLWWK